MVAGLDADEFVDEGMVLLAGLVSRVDAVVTRSMLEATGISVWTGALHHASVSINSQALGGYRIYVPSYQYVAASNVLREVLSDQTWQFCHGARRAILRVIAIWLFIPFTANLAAIASGAGSFAALLLLPLEIFSLPVNPQGRGDYFLAKAPRPPQL